MESAPALAKEVHTIFVEVAACELIGHYAAAAASMLPQHRRRRDVPLPAIFRLGPYVHACLQNILCASLQIVVEFHNVVVQIQKNFTS